MKKTFLRNSFMLISFLLLHFAHRKSDLNVEDISSIKECLNGLTGFSFRYRDPPPSANQNYLLTFYRFYYL